MLKKCLLSTRVLFLFFVSISPIFAIGPGGSPPPNQDPGEEQNSSASSSSAPPTVLLDALEEPLLWEDLEQLWNLEDGRQTQNRVRLYPTLLQMAQDPENSYQPEAIDYLWDYPETAEEKQALHAFLFPSLLQIAQATTPSQQWRTVVHQTPQWQVQQWNTTLKL